MKVFRRSLGMRALSLGSLLLFAALEIYHLATGGGPLSAGGLVLEALVLFSAAAVVLNLGDRYRIDEEGIAYTNPLLARLGLGIDRRIRWSEVTAVRAHRGLTHGLRERSPSALFLEVASGRRFVIDSVEDLEEIRRLIDAHLARRSGETPGGSGDWRPPAPAARSGATAPPPLFQSPAPRAGHERETKR